MNTNYVNYSDNNIEPITKEFHDIVDDAEIEIAEENVIEDTDDKIGKVTCKKLYLRSEPSTDSKEITVLSEGDELMIVHEDDEWYEVYTASGQEGFCKKAFVEIV